ncbi:hypothetical protein ColTof4_13559 [Colletotrichum tofieldiae]|nr:hypothetical protein ColTof3_14510 [Colletotrichum tofieldiae]GKT81136.1 hypothetical protein ColTof4_13559 [Colletotrichum tofieldiae]
MSGEQSQVRAESSVQPSSVAALLGVGPRDHAPNTRHPGIAIKVQQPKLSSLGFFVLAKERSEPSISPPQQQTSDSHWQ